MLYTVFILHHCFSDHIEDVASDNVLGAGADEAPLVEGAKRVLPVEEAQGRALLGSDGKDLHSLLLPIRAGRAPRFRRDEERRLPSVKVAVEVHDKAQLRPPVLVEVMLQLAFGVDPAAGPAPVSVGPDVEERQQAPSAPPQHHGLVAAASSILHR